MKVIPAEPRHVAGMVACHQVSFPGQFTTLLGPAYLRTLYGLYVDHPDGICLVAVEESEDAVRGLVAGGRPDLPSRMICRNLWRFVPILLWRALTHGYFRRRLLYHVGAAIREVARRLRLVRASPERPPPPKDPPGTWSNLLSICTHPDHRGRGVGRSLLEGFRAESEHRGYRTMRLSVRNENAAAIALYKACGWRPVLTVPNGTYFKRSVRPKPGAVPRDEADR